MRHGHNMLPVTLSIFSSWSEEGLLYLSCLSGCSHVCLICRWLFTLYTCSFQPGETHQSEFHRQFQVSFDLRVSLWTDRSQYDFSILFIRAVITICSRGKCHVWVVRERIGLLFEVIWKLRYWNWMMEVFNLVFWSLFIFLKDSFVYGDFIIHFICIYVAYSNIESLNVH